MSKAALVLYISGTNFGGAERRLIRIYNELGKKMDCDLIVRGCALDILKKGLIKADCDVSNIHKIICFKNNVECIVYLCLHRKYSSIHYFDLCGFNQILASVCKRLSIKTIETIAFQNYAYGIIDDKTKKQLIKLLNLSNKVDVLFPVGKKYFESICSNTNITVTPGTFTNIDLYSPKIKRKLIVLAASRMEKDKNAVMLVEACNICQKEIRDSGYKVVISGHGEQEQEIKNKIIQYGMSDFISTPGYIKTSEIFPYAELAVSIDLIENYPAQVIAEELASGCSLICTDVGNSRIYGEEPFIDYIMVEPKALAEALQKWIKYDDSYKEDILKMARKYAEKNFTIETNTKYFESLICN